MILVQIISRFLFRRLLLLLLFLLSGNPKNAVTYLYSDPFIDKAIMYLLECFPCMSCVSAPVLYNITDKCFFPGEHPLLTSFSLASNRQSKPWQTLIHHSAHGAQARAVMQPALETLFGYSAWSQHQGGNQSHHAPGWGWEMEERKCSLPLGRFGHIIEKLHSVINEGYYGDPEKVFCRPAKQKTNRYWDNRWSC